MPIPLEKLLNANNNRYETCVAAIKVAQRMTDHINILREQEQELLHSQPAMSAMVGGNYPHEKIAVMAIDKVLNGKINITKGIEEIAEENADI